MLAGLTITNGHRVHGGGIHCGDSSPTITDCIITANAATDNGGGIYCSWDSSPKITNCNITSNTAQYGGGGIYLQESSKAAIADCNIAANTAEYSGGIYCGDSSPTITDCIITANAATDNGGGIYCSWDSSPKITNCNITSNTAQYGGGGIYLQMSSKAAMADCNIAANTAKYGGGIFCVNGTIKHCTIAGNTAHKDGGGLCLGYGTVTDCNICQNYAGATGGGISCWWPSEAKISKCNVTSNSAGEKGGGISHGLWNDVTNCAITGNSAGDDGGGLYLCFRVRDCVINCNLAGDNGGGMYCRMYELIITNCTISGNVAAGGAGGGISRRDCELIMTNSILWGNSDQIFPGFGGAVSHSCIQDGYPGIGNISNDPMFVREPDDGGDGWGFGDNDDFGDLHLQSGSPCINAGHPLMWIEPNSVDMDGEPRIMGGVVDMGADEFPIQMITVTKPQGGEVWAAGSWHTITWESYGVSGTVDILFSSNEGGEWAVVDDNTGNTGSYLWHLPGEVDSNQCLISIVPSEADPNVVCVESGLFTIQHYPSRPGAPPGQMHKWDNFRRTGLSDTFGPELGCVKWTFEADGLVSASVTVGVDDRVAIACEDGKLYTLDANGALLWSYDTNSPLISSPVLGYYGMTYVGGENGKLYAIDGGGKLRWTHTTDGFIYSSGAVSADGQVYVCSEDGKLYALGPDGSELWTFETDSPGVVGNSIFASPAIGADGTVYIGGLRDPNLYALDPNDGSVKWACNFEYRVRTWSPSNYTESGWPFASPVVAADGTIYQTLLYDPNLYAIKPNEPNAGTIIWSTNLADSESGWFESGYINRHGDVDGWSEPALGPDGTIYVSLNDPYLRAVEPNGSIKWVTRLGMMDGFTLTVGSDGLVYAAGNDGWLCVVDTNGNELARFQNDDWVIFPVISAGNTIIVSDANRVWAIDGCPDGAFVLHRPEDVDASRVVDFVDFALLAVDWLACNDLYPPCDALIWDGTYFTGDIDRNLYVDFVDVAAIANRWLSAD